MRKKLIQDVKRGDVVEFKKYALRVESEPRHGKGSTTLQGRVTVDGSPLVTKHFLNNREVTVR